MFANHSDKSIWLVETVFLVSIQIALAIEIASVKPKNQIINAPGINFLNTSQLKCSVANGL
jgi:hypothetical protein